MTARVECPPGLAGEGDKAPQSPVLYGDYLLERLNKNYPYRQKAG
jgi:hypothetical protein